MKGLIWLAYPTEGRGTTRGGGGGTFGGGSFGGAATAGGFGGAMLGGGYGGVSSLLMARRKPTASAPYPGGTPQPPTIDPSRGQPQIPGGLPYVPPDTGPLGDLGISPEGWAQNKEKGRTPFDELQGLVDARSRANLMLGRGPVNYQGQGFGIGSPIPDMLRKLLQARMGGGY